MTVEKFVKCGKFPGPWKGSLIVETVLDSGMVYCIFILYLNGL